MSQAKSSSGPDSEVETDLIRIDVVALGLSW
jgi:hypothetical protein